MTNSVTKTLKIAAMAATFAMTALAGQAMARDVEAGPIWNDEDAKFKCPVVASAYEGNWNGNWKTTVEGEMSVCGITNIPVVTLEAGPIWNQEDAEKKCPVVGYSVQGKWNGQWWTTVEGKMSVCQINLND